MRKENIYPQVKSEKVKNIEKKKIWELGPPGRRSREKGEKAEARRMRRSQLSFSLFGETAALPADTKGHGDLPTLL